MSEKVGGGQLTPTQEPESHDQTPDVDHALRVWYDTSKEPGFGLLRVTTGQHMVCNPATVRSLSIHEVQYDVLGQPYWGKGDYLELKQVLVLSPILRRMADHILELETELEVERRRAKSAELS